MASSAPERGGFGRSAIVGLTGPKCFCNSAPLPRLGGNRTSSIFLAAADDVAGVLRQSARKQLDSYGDMWIAFFEALQNALDAVEGNLGERRVRIIISPADNSVTVSDNGSGFPPDPQYFGLGKGTKGDLNNRNIRGEHGVGLKMVILCTDRFELWTKTKKGTVWKALFEEGCRFIDAGERETFVDDAKDSEIPDGFVTTVKYRFPRDQVEIPRHIDLRILLQSLFERYRDVLPHAALKKRDLTSLFVEHFFRTSCYTGDVNRLFDDIIPATVEVNLLSDSGLSREELAKTYPKHLLDYWSKPATVTFPAKYWNPLEWYPEPEKKGYRTKKELAAFNASVKTPRMMWVLKLSTPDEYRLLLQNPHVRDGIDPRAFDTLLNEKIRGIYIVIGPASKGARYNINEVMLNHVTQVVAADGVVTTNQLRAPRRGRNQNYLNNIHMVINIADRVNYGKQGVKNPLLLSRLYDYFEEAYVKKLVDLAVSVAGKAPPSPPAPPTFEIVSLPSLDEPDLGIAKVPVFENTLIALTHELIAKGRIKGVKAYQISSIDQYDCRGQVEFHNRAAFIPTRDADLQAIEYKVTLMELVSDCELGNKDLGEIHLAVVWDATLDPSVAKYQLLDLEASSYEDLAVTGVEHVLRDITTGNECPVLEVRKLVKVKGGASQP